ncbi:MAG TPA: effector binding domain-containing protein [Candidatus Hodarchaeales archaeon]|nr:effector binding domain-containing protein [Candidatus Hodarchaeales archaeon]
MFGFNNPNPSPNRKEYGYEVWIKIISRLDPDRDDVETQRVNGGLYAVTRTKLIVNEENVIPSWERIAHWVNSSKAYMIGQHQWLERHLNPLARPEELILDLYCQIESEKSPDSPAVRN